MPERASRRSGLAWVVQQFQRGPTPSPFRQQAGLLLAVPSPDAALIAVVDGLHADVRASFWERMAPMRADPRPGRSWRATSSSTAAPGLRSTCLVRCSRPIRGTGPALDSTSSSRRSSLAASDSSVDAQHAASLSWEVGELLNYLERSSSDLQTRARLEFLFTNLLRFTRPARALDEALRTDPALFAEIALVRVPGRGRPPGPGRAADASRRRGRLRRAALLAHASRRPPGRDH